MLQHRGEQSGDIFEHTAQPVLAFRHQFALEFFDAGWAAREPARALVRQADLALRLGLTEQYVRKIIKQLKDSGLIERVGARKKGYWKIIENK